MKKLYALLSILCLLSFANFAWGGGRETETLTCSAGTISSDQMTWTSLKSCVITHKNGTGSLRSYSPWRIYANNIVDIVPNAGCTITKIEITCSTNDYANSGKNTWSNASVSASGSTITVTPTNQTTTISYKNTNGGQVRWSSIKVTYEVASSDYSIHYDLTGCRLRETGRGELWGDDVDHITAEDIKDHYKYLYFDANDGYILPDDITVKMGTSRTLNPVTDYGWTASDGFLDILFTASGNSSTIAEPTDDYYITITATKCQPPTEPLAYEDKTYTLADAVIIDLEDLMTGRGSGGTIVYTFKNSVSNTDAEIADNFFSANNVGSYTIVATQEDFDNECGGYVEFTITIEETPSTTVNLTQDLLHINCTTTPLPVVIEKTAQNVTLAYEVTDNYLLPETINIKMGAEQLPMTENYSWEISTTNPNQAVLDIHPKNGFTGNIAINIYGTLPAPTDLTVTDITATTAKVNWTKVTHPNVTGYVVYYYYNDGNANEGEGSVTVGKDDALPQLIENLVPNKNYMLDVKVIDKDTPKTDKSSKDVVDFTTKEYDYTVTWYVNGEPYTEGTPTTQVIAGQKVTTLPADPAGTALGDCADSFVGWSENELGPDEDQPAPADLFNNENKKYPSITADRKEFHAVFATGILGKATTYDAQKITSRDDIEDGGLYIIEITDNSVNRVATNTTLTSSGLNTITEYQFKNLTSSESYIWKFIGSAKSIEIVNNAVSSFQVNYSGSSTSLSSAYKIDPTKWTFDYVESEWKISVNSAERFLGLGNNSTIKAYANWETNTTNKANIQLYKLYHPDITTYSNYYTKCTELASLGEWTGLETTDIEWKTATLKWNPLTENVAKYEVKVTAKDNPELYNQTYTIEDVTTSTMELSDLTRGTEYEWTITAIPVAGSGYGKLKSDVQTFETKPCEKLPAPESLSITYDEATGKYTLSWDPVEGATGYRMNGGFTGTITGNSSSQQLDREPGKEYDQSVTALGDDERYCDSDPATIKYNGHIFTLTLTVVDNGAPKSEKKKVYKYTLPKPSSSCDEYQFVGWSKTSIPTETNATPEDLQTDGTEITVTENTTLYAVFSKTEKPKDPGKEGSTTLTLKGSTLTSPWTSTDGSIWTFSNLAFSTVGTGGFKGTGTATVQLPSGCVGKSINVKCTGNQTAKDVYLAISTESININKLSVSSIGSNSEKNISLTDNQCAGSYTFARSDSKSSNVAYIASIIVNYEPSPDVTTYTTHPMCCDDVPTDVSYTSEANGITLSWKMDAPTATIELYADAECATLVGEAHTNATSPLTITGLEKSTTYYAVIKAGGTCATKPIEVTTEYPQIDVVEWAKDKITILLNTDEEVKFGLEEEVAKGSGNENVAEELFFSKYFEAQGDNKLIAVYNGTKETISLDDYYITNSSQNSSQIQLSDYGEVKGSIAPGEEIILVKYDATNSGKDCVDDEEISNKWNETSSNVLLFGGRLSIGLYKNGELIDVIGSSDGSGVLNSVGTSCGEDDSYLKVEGVKVNDKPCFFSLQGDNIKTQMVETDYSLSTNRCLLVRRNTVKSGANAVATNIETTNDCATLSASFRTLGAEWSGLRIGAGKSSNEDIVNASCEGFGYVGEFNYTDYYTTFEPIELEKSQFTPADRNADGTITLNLPEGKYLSNENFCKQLRITLSDKEGNILLQSEPKVPIIIDADNTIAGENFPDATVCQTCDVVVRDSKTLTHNTESNAQFQNMYVYPGGKVQLASGANTLQLDKLYMFAHNDDVAYVINNNTAATALSAGEVVHIKRVDGQYWYPFSLPYDCNVEEIIAYYGKALGRPCTNENDLESMWGIKEYNGKQRQASGKSTTVGGQSENWDWVYSGTLKANKGYVIGLFGPESEEKIIEFKPATALAYAETSESKQTQIENWYTDNLLTSEPRHHGWNFTGSPYLSEFGATSFQSQTDVLRMLATDGAGNEIDVEHVYVSVPNKGAMTYRQTLASDAQLKPFTAYFVQAVDPTNAQDNMLDLTYSKGTTVTEQAAPRRATEREAVIFVELNVTADNNKQLTDNAGLQVSDRFTDNYEIGFDLEKMYAAADRPQLYTVASDRGKLAYNALSDQSAQNIPLGLYVPQAGDYTLSLNRRASRLQAAESVYLLQNGIVVADLMLQDYTLSAAKGEQAGYSLDIRRATKVVTDVEQIGTDEPYAIMCDGQLTIGNLPTASDVAIYDALGRLVWSEQQATTPVVADLPQTGVYMVLITSGEQQYVLKSLNR